MAVGHGTPIFPSPAPSSPAPSSPLTPRMAPLLWGAYDGWASGGLLFSQASYLSVPRCLCFRVAPRLLRTACQGYPLCPLFRRTTT